MARLGNAIIPALINFSKHKFLTADLFLELAQNLCTKIFEIAKVYKNYASKESKYSKVVDLIHFLYRGI